MTVRKARRRIAPARFALAGALALLFALALASPAAALEQKVTAVDGAAGDTLGRSVAVDGTPSSSAPPATTEAEARSTSFGARATAGGRPPR